jgi:hypothetical protein
MARHEADERRSEPIWRFFPISKTPYAAKTYKTVHWQTLIKICVSGSAGSRGELGLSLESDEAANDLQSVVTDARLSEFEIFELQQA